MDKSIIKEEFGFVNGYKVFLFTLTNKNGAVLKLTNLAAAMVSIIVPDKNSKPTDVLLGYDDCKGYEKGGSSQGATVGRFANRIGGAKFTLNGVTYNLAKNNGENCLHGGNIGFNKRVWTVEGITYGAAPSVTFGYVSPDGEENFPSELKVRVSFTLTAENSVRIEYYAVSDGDTIVNLTNHSYFNLAGFDGGKVLDTELTINAEGYTLVDDGLIPTGEIAPVENTVFDFRTAKAIGTDIASGKTDGYDHNFIVGEPHILKEAARAYCPRTGIEMTVKTDMPAMQLYTANGLNEVGKNGKTVGKHDAFCLETQFTPDTPNLPQFPSCVLKKGEEYRFVTEYGFSAR